MDSQVDRAAAADVQDREERVRILQSALVEAWQSGDEVRLDFSGNRQFGAGGCGFWLDDLPDGRLLVGASVELLRINRSWLYDDYASLAPEDARRDRTLKEAGWAAGNYSNRMWELDPADEVAVGHIVDDLQFVFDASAVPADTVWRIRAEKPTSSATTAAPREEPWVVDATEHDLGQRLLRLAGLRGGWIEIRYGSGSSTVLRVAAHRDRQSIVVEATNLGPTTAREGHPSGHWTERWTLSERPLDARGTFRALAAALASLSPPGSGGSVSIRVRLGREASYWADNFDTDPVVVMLVTIAFIGIVFLLGDPASEGLLGATGRAMDGRASIADVFMLVALAGAWMLATSPVLGVTKAIADACKMRYSVGREVMAGGFAVASTAFLVVVLLAGSSWGAVAAVPWVLWLISRTLRGAGGAEQTVDRRAED